MAEDGVDLTNKEGVVNEFILPGSYRKLIERPRDMQWEILRYEDATTQLTRTDLDILYNRPEPQSVSSTLSLKEQTNYQKERERERRRPKRCGFI